MNKQSSIYFLVFLAVVIVIGYIVYTKVIKGNDVVSTFDTSPVSQIKTEEPLQNNEVIPNKEETPKQNENIKPTKKPMQNSDVTKLDIQVVSPGTGTVVSKSGDILSMNYTGMLLDGSKFDSNVDPLFNHVTPFSFTLGKGQVIRGWDEGLMGMKVGEKRVLTIPSDMAYGPYSPSPKIPPNSALVFEVELLKIN